MLGGMRRGERLEYVEVAFALTTRAPQSATAEIDRRPTRYAFLAEI